MVKPAYEQTPGTTVTLIKGVGGSVRRTVLPGGIRIVTEAMPDVRSAAFGVWVGVGSRDETPIQAGASHFLEHLLFKGTDSRSALDISSSVESVGGEMNAFTAKELTCFYARVLDTNLPMAIEVITDMMTSSLVRTADVDGERNVVLEEMAMRDDDASDLVHDEFASALLGDTPVGRPIIGSLESITNMSRRVVHGYYKRHYLPQDMVFAAAGNLDHATVVRQVKKALAASGWLEGDARPSGPRPSAMIKLGKPGARLIKRDSEQVNVVLGVPSINQFDDRRYAMNVLNAVLGGGMSSRLFQEVREKRGLAYSVYSYNQSFADAGAFGVYAGCPPKRFDDVIEICRQQLDQIKTNGVTQDELDRNKGQVRGGMVLSLEDTGSRMSRIGRAELVYGEIKSVDELLRRIDAVTVKDLADLAAQVLDAPLSIAAVGPFDSVDQLRRAVS